MKRPKRFHPFRLLMIAIACLASASSLHAETRRIALIIDDGPSPANAAKLLQLFAQEKIHVSFAQVAKTVLQHPETTRSMLAAGHEIVNHSYSHAHPKPLSNEELHHEIVDAQHAIAKAADFSPTWYWPPFLELDDRMPSLFTEAGIQPFTPVHLVSSDDWNMDTNAEEIYRRATTGVQDLTVILFHEWRDETAAQMPAIIAELKRQGCVFHTFSQLAKQK